MFLLNRPSNGAVRRQQDAAVLQNARKERPTRPRFIGDDLRSGKTFSMLLEALDAKELGTNGLGVGKEAKDWPGCIHCVFRTTADSSRSPFDRYTRFNGAMPQISLEQLVWSAILY